MEVFYIRKIDRQLLYSVYCIHVLEWIQIVTHIILQMGSALDLSKALQLIEFINFMNQDLGAVHVVF